MSDIQADHEHAIPPSPITADQLLQRLLTLILTSHGLDAITHQRVSEVTGLRPQLRANGSWGWSGRLTDVWTSWFAHRTDIRPGFHFQFAGPDDEVHYLNEICTLDYDAFSRTLTGGGFANERRYGEHGRHLSERFVRGDLLVNVFTEGDDTAHPGRRMRLWVSGLEVRDNVTS